MDASPLPSAGVRGARAREPLHVVIAWSLDEPARIGEIAVLESETKTVLGRGSAQPDDGAPRAVFHRVRPGQSAGGAPLSSQRISRSQLRFEPVISDAREAAGDAVVVKNIGKTLLSMHGAVIDRTTLRHGGVVILQNAMVLLVVKRPRAIEPVAICDRAFPFGTADANGIVGESAAVWALRESLAAKGTRAEGDDAEDLARDLPIDERLEDVPLLVRHLLVRAAEKSPQIAGRFMDRDGAKLDPALMEALLRHRYTTHVRELDKLLWTALSTSRGDVIEKTREVDEALAAGATSV